MYIVLNIDSFGLYSNECAGSVLFLNSHIQDPIWEISQSASLTVAVFLHARKTCGYIASVT